MTTISPSILSADFSHLGADCRMVLDAGAQMLHYDVMDGHFVPNISFGVPVLKSLHKALPDAFYDVHLMITHPQQYAEAFAKAGASLLNFHLECDDDIQETIDAIKAQGCKVGMTIKPGTPVEELGYYLDQLDLVLVMSVEPGFGGQKFMPRPRQAPLAQGGKRPPRPEIPAGSGRRRGCRHRSAVRHRRCGCAGGGQRHLWRRRPRRGRPCDGSSLRGDCPWMKH